MKHYKYILLLFILSILACENLEKGKSKETLNRKGLNITFIKGLDLVYNRKIEIKVLEREEIYLKTSSNNGFSYLEGNLTQYDSSSISFNLNKFIGIGLCKNFKWGNPMLGIGLDSIVLKDFNELGFQVINTELEIDTTIQVNDLISYFEMPSSKNKSVNVKLVIQPKEDFKFEFDTLEFDYYRTMICVDSKIYGTDTVKLELSDSAIIYNNQYYTIIDKNLH